MIPVRPSGGRPPIPYTLHPAGLAPHHDDVELFVCQTAGSKRWRLYAPVDGHQLPGAASGDLEEALLGDPIADITLQVTCHNMGRSHDPVQASVDLSRHP